MKTSASLQGAVWIFLVGLALWFGKPFLVPLCYAFLIAMVFYPMCKKLESVGFGKFLSIAIPLIIVCLLFAGLVFLLSYQMALISHKWPLIQKQLDVLVQQIHQYLENEYGWTTEAQNNWVLDNLKSLRENAGTIIGETSKAMLGALFNLVIIPVYVALLLSYRRRLVDFLGSVLPESFRPNLPSVLAETVTVFSKFIRGMVVVYLLVGLLNGLGLWAIGIDNPFVYGMLTAIMTIIPYFGIIISAMLPVTLSWLNTGTIWQPIGVISVFSVVQYLEANVIFPYVVGRYVNLNTLAAIIAIFLGALFWGVSGMILFLPLFALIRIFASHYPELKPWAKLLAK
jgi:predicted PurR-regulated permease PerM